eukprot:TRINITY_DN16662_c0_g1_i1.p1 TRINITY_DN16662_c0_g1~~TRINITY_DN16662_c0_g1_i1.p1  ORF type:complete len:256 (+),score=41.98 TRINITY_DN16662_c0_g1_i1:71-769(+)
MAALLIYVCEGDQKHALEVAPTATTADLLTAAAAVIGAAEDTFQLRFQGELLPPVATALADLGISMECAVHASRTDMVRFLAEPSLLDWDRLPARARYAEVAEDGASVQLGGEHGHIFVEVTPSVKLGGNIRIKLWTSGSGSFGHLLRVHRSPHLGCDGIVVQFNAGGEYEFQLGPDGLRALSCPEACRQACEALRQAVPFPDQWLESPDDGVLYMCLYLFSAGTRVRILQP